MTHNSYPCVLPYYLNVKTFQYFAIMMTVNSFVFFPFVAQDPCATLRQCSKSCMSQKKSCDIGLTTHPCVVVTQCDDLSHLPPNPNNTCYARHGPATITSTSSTTTMIQTSATTTRSMVVIHLIYRPVIRS